MGLNKDIRLTKREEAIIKEVLEIYFKSGEPVSSRTVSKVSTLNLSPATIRSIMADLEEKKMLFQPYSYAGRIPTSKAIHYYVENLVDIEKLPSTEKDYIVSRLCRREEASTVIEEAVQILAELTQFMGVAMIPSFEDVEVHTIHFIPLEDTKILCVIVTKTGFVISKKVPLDEKIPTKVLAKFADFINDNYKGFSLRRIREKVIEDIKQLEIGNFLASVSSIVNDALYCEEGEVVIEGTVSLLKRFSDPREITTLLNTFNDKLLLLKILSSCLEIGNENRGPVVLIGEEVLPGEDNLALVGFPFLVGKRVKGTVGVLGVVAMQYRHVISLVKYTASKLEERLEYLSLGG